MRRKSAAGSDVGKPLPRTAAVATPQIAPIATCIAKATEADKEVASKHQQKNGHQHYTTNY